MTDALEFAQKLAGLGLGTLLLLILFGSYLGVWMWTKDFKAQKAEWEIERAKDEAEFKARLEKSELSAQRWQDMALSAVGLAETSADVARRWVRTPDRGV